MTKPQELSIDSLKNCCTHNIDVELPTGEIATIRPSNTTIRIVTGDGVKCIAGGIPIAQKVYFHSALLPPEIPGVIYIVPKQVALVYADPGRFRLSRHTVCLRVGRRDEPPKEREAASVPSEAAPMNESTRLSHETRT